MLGDAVYLPVLVLLRTQETQVRGEACHLRACLSIPRGPSSSPPLRSCSSQGPAVSQAHVSVGLCVAEVPGGHGIHATAVF